MDVASLSALSGLSSYHMMRLFKQETGYTVGNYITEKRLIKARDLMSQAPAPHRPATSAVSRTIPPFYVHTKNAIQDAPKTS